MKQRDKATQVIDLTRRLGVLRPRDLDAHGIPRTYLQRLHRRQLVERVGRGLYVLADAHATVNHTLAQAGKRVPHGIVCLISALRFHELTTQAPFQIWMAIEQKAWLPKVQYPPIKFVRFSGAALTEGIEEHQIEGVTVRIYNPAKTVADCFKYRNKIGLDVALEALRDCIRQRKCTVDQLWHYGDICRVTRVMKPYIEAIT